MALTYKETDDLTKDPVFRGRVSVACVHYASYIIDEAATTPAHSTRYKWAQQTLVVPEVAVNQVISTVSNDSAVQDAGLTGTPPTSAITDAALQTAVEAAVNKLL